MLLKFGFIIVGTIFSFYVFYSCSARYLKIKDLPPEIISNGDRLRYLSVLQKYILTTAGATLVSLLTLLSPILELRFLIPIIGIFLSTAIYMNLSDEIADFDISKKDSDIIQDFLEKRTKTSKDNAKENKIKKIDLDEFGITNKSNEISNNKDDKKDEN